MLSLFTVSAQSDNISKTMSPNDSVTVSVKFERVKLPDEEITKQVLLLNMENSVKTTEVLAANINKLTTVLEQTAEIASLTKADIVAKQLGLDLKDFNKYYQRNNTFILISLLPTLVIAFWSMSQFLMQKGLDVKHLLAGTAVLTLYGLLASGVLYAVLSLIFNKQYFVIKDLMSALF